MHASAIPPRARAGLRVSLLLVAGLLPVTVWASAEIVVSGLPASASGGASTAAESSVAFEDAKVQQDPGIKPPLYTVTLTGGHASRTGAFLQWAKLASTSMAETSRRDATLLVDDRAAGSSTGAVRYDLRLCAPYRLAASANEGAQTNVDILALSCKGVAGPTPATP